MSPRTGGALLLLLLAWTSGCTGGPVVDDTTRPGSPVTVGAFDFPESELLAELYAQALERAGVPVHRLGRLGPREILAPALQQHLVDLVPEYLGSAMHFATAAVSTTSAADPRPGATVAPDVDALDALLAPHGLSALPAAAADNRNAVVVPRQVAARLRLVTISDLAAIGDPLVVGGPAECPQRPACLRGLTEVYGIRPAAFLPLADAGDVVAALDAGEIDVGVLFTTDAQLSPAAHTILLDDRGLQPPERVVPIVSDAALATWPTIGPTLAAVGEDLTTAELRGLNRAVHLHGVPPATAVGHWLDRTVPPTAVRSGS